MMIPGTASGSITSESSRVRPRMRSPNEQPRRRHRQRQVGHGRDGGVGERILDAAQGFGAAEHEAKMVERVAVGQDGVDPPARYGGQRHAHMREDRREDDDAKKQATRRACRRGLAFATRGPARIWLSRPGPRGRRGTCPARTGRPNCRAAGRPCCRRSPWSRCGRAP